MIAEIRPDILALQEADTRFGGRTALQDLGDIRHDLGLRAYDSPLSRRASDYLPIKARLRLDGAVGATLT